MESIELEAADANSIGGRLLAPRTRTCSIEPSEPAPRRRLMGTKQAMTWKRVCSADEVESGRLAAFVVDGISVVVANLGDDGFSVFPPSCPHMEEPLDQSGMCAGSILTCSKHLYQWDMCTGEAIDPAENDRVLLRYESKVEGGDLLARVENELLYEHDDDEDDDFEW